MNNNLKTEYLGILVNERYHTRICYLRLTNVKHSKNCYAQYRTYNRRLVITNEPNVHHQNRRILIVLYHFYYFNKTNIYHKLFKFGKIKNIKFLKQI